MISLPPELLLGNLIEAYEGISRNPVASVLSQRFCDSVTSISQVLVALRLNEKELCLEPQKNRSRVPDALNLRDSEQSVSP